MRGNYVRFLTIFWNMLPVPQVSQPFWAQQQRKNTVRARSRAISNLIKVLQRKLTQKHTHTHTDRHAHAQTQHGTAHLFRGNFELQTTGRKQPYARALVAVPPSRQSTYRDTHTHAPEHTHTHTYTHIHTHARTQRRTAHTHTHTRTVMIRFRCATAVFFLQFFERPTSPTQWAFQETVQSAHLGRWGPSQGSPLATEAECPSSSAPARRSVDMRISSGICGPNWEPRAGRGSRRAGKTSTRMRSSPNPEPTRPRFRGCSEGRSAMSDRRDARIRKRRGRRDR